MRFDSDRRWAMGVSFAVVLLTALPYLYDWSLQGLSAPYGRYSGFTFNITDNCVYMSWMRQYADGGWFQRNLFTTEPQTGHQFNVFYLALGKIAGITRLPIVAVYQAARIVVCFAFLHALWWLLTGLIRDGRARRTAFLTVCLGSGLGWVPGLWERGFAGPVDTWQPEAVTFLSLYLFPLFAVSMALMIGIIGFMLEAERRTSWRHALAAGLCGLVLGNIHTYDVVTVIAVWATYLIVRTVAERRVNWGAWARGLIAAGPTALSSGYMLYLLRTEEVFARRAAVPTLSLPITWVLLGFGLLAPLALVGIWAYRSRGNAARDDSAATALDRNALLLLVVWAVVNVAVSYAPVSFQRKMLMGAHIPIAVLAGLGIAALTSRLPGKAKLAAAGAILVLLFGTNARFMARDRGSLRQCGETVRGFMFEGERSALDWIRANVPRGTAIQPLPWIAVSPDGRTGFTDTTVACFAPGITGDPVHAGHWGETPDFGGTMNLWRRFLLPDTPDEWRRDLLRRTGVRWLVFSQKRPETRDDATAQLLAAGVMGVVPEYVRHVPEASNEDAVVYEVLGP